jgi:methyl coenzyme M reductase gamma subunit
MEEDTHLTTQTTGYDTNFGNNEYNFPSNRTPSPNHTCGCSIAEKTNQDLKEFSLYGRDQVGFRNSNLNQISKNLENLYINSLPTGSGIAGRKILEMNIGRSKNLDDYGTWFEGLESDKNDPRLNPVQETNGPNSIGRDFSKKIDGGTCVENAVGR